MSRTTSRPKSLLNDEEIIARLRAQRQVLPASRLAELLESLADGGLSQGTMITYFKRAFPSIPLRVLLDAGEWSRVSGGQKNDEWFDELLQPWLQEN